MKLSALTDSSPPLHRPNFTLAFLRPHPHQPPNYATFLTPLWMNKFDLKDYLYNLYNVEAIHIRSYIIHGKVRRERRTGVLFRRPQKKKMTIEMKAGDNFVWPDAPEDLEPWNQKLQRAQEEEKKEAMEGRTQAGTNLQPVPRDERKGIREQARALLEGRQKWKPGWQVHGTETGPLGAQGGVSATV